MLCLINFFKPFKKIYIDYVLLIFFILFTLIFAFTINMGGDYGLYEKNYYFNGELKFEELLKNKELIYNVLARIFYELSFNYVSFSIFIKLISITLIYIFIRTCFENKLLISCLFLSFYIYSLTLGIVRQGLAIAIFLMVIIFWGKLKLIKFVFVTSLLSLIHIASAFIIILKLNIKNFIKIFLLIVPLFGIYFIFLGIDHFFGLIDVYVIRKEHYSYGFFSRFALILPIIILYFRHKDKIKNSAYAELFISTNYIAIPVLLIFTLANPTISDRLLFFLYPIYFLIFDKIMTVLNMNLKKIYASIFLLLNFTFLNVWLTLGNNIKFFIPIKHLFQ